MRSLHSFCIQYEIPKTTLKRWLNDNGYDTSNGLTPDAVAAAKVHFRIEEPPTPVVTGELSVVTGNHCTSIDLPSYQGLTVDLAQFRDSSALVIENPLAVADQFLQAADSIQLALQADIAAREARLAQTRQAQDVIAAKAQELQLEQRLYRLQTGQLDQAQTAEAQALAANLEALQRLGKPADTQG
jgi:hypothetical protein